MRIRSLVLVAAAAGLGLGLSGCTGTGGSSPAASPGASTNVAASPSGPGSAAGTAPTCAVGTWTSTGFNGSLATVGVTGALSGGAGYTLTIAANGATVADFTQMQPVTFSSSVSGTDVRGTFRYGGKVSGTIRMSTGGAAASGAAAASPSLGASVAAGAAGSWEPVGTADFSALTVTAELTSPVQAKVADNVKVSDFAAGQTGGSVDTNPIFKTGTYRCGGDTLTLGPPADAPVGGTWTLRRG